VIGDGTDVCSPLSSFTEISAILFLVDIVRLFTTPKQTKAKEQTV
jgi:hypothetical protein